MSNLINTKPNNFFQWKVQKPDFANSNLIWNKSNRFRYQKDQDEFKMAFYKIGKTFGFFTKRFLAFRKNYIQNQESNEVKGYCNLQNLYCGFFKTQEKNPYLVYLTNFKNHAEIYFAQLTELNKFKSLMVKYVIQLDFQNYYELSQKIGQGSFSKVHLAKKIQNSQQYAVKIVKKIDKNNVKSKDSVQLQKSALQKISSEYVSKLYQFFQDETNYYFVLQYLPGSNLMTLIKEKYKFDLEAKLFILKGILNGLVNCHQNSIIHRDIKPQNIIINMLTSKPKIIDLGLCLIVDESTDLRSYKRCGTMGYIAPEVIVNNSENRKMYDEKCDIFSFGIVAHLLLLGFNPLKGKNYEQTFMKNKSCKFQLNKLIIQKQYGIKCFEFLSQVLQIDAKKRLSAEQALKHEFFDVKKKKEEGKTSTTQKQVELIQKKIENAIELTEEKQLSIQQQKNLPNISKYCIKKNW